MREQRKFMKMLYGVEGVKSRVAGNIHGRHGSEVCPVRASSQHDGLGTYKNFISTFSYLAKSALCNSSGLGELWEDREVSHPDERDKAKDKEEEMSGQGALRDEASELRKLGMADSSHLDYKSILKDRLLKNIWDAGDAQVTQAA